MWNRRLQWLCGLVLAAVFAAPAAGAQQSAAKHSAGAQEPPATALNLPQPAQEVLNAVSAQRIRVHTKFLSSDGLEGRGTGQRGGDIAADYIAAQFALYGLQPAGENGTYMQHVPMVGITTDPSSKVTFTPANGTPFEPRLSDDIVAMDETQNAASEVNAPIIFVGYGIQAPEYNWDDYKGVDVHGKVLLMLVNEPPSKDPQFFKGPALTYYGRWTYKYEQAARMGAVGAILIHRTDMASYGWDVVRNSWGGERSYLKAGNSPKLKLAAWVQYTVAQQLVATANLQIDKLIEQAQSRDFQPIPLPLRVHSQIASKIRPFDSNNVLAMLPGSDPNLKGQAVLYSAHYDHLGIHPDQKGDNIYNGAVDNATGSAILLDIAHAFSRAGSAPPRSILFAAVTGEEQGLLGSEYLGQHPPIPAGSISLALNFDGLSPLGIPEDVELVGAERTTFYPIIQNTARDFNLAIDPDSNPGAGFYYRSDHFSFAHVGIPAFSINEGMKFQGHPEDWGVQQERDYNEKHYHQPSDEFQESWDFSGLAKIARFGIALGWQAASQPDLVSWLPGDEFEAARHSSQMTPAPAPAQQTNPATK
jgi:Zn-dependent M28 family amino/carboxypeptidase